MKLSAVKPMHVTDFFKSINQYSNSTQKKARFVLTAMFEAAIDNELCGRNPVRNVKITAKPQAEKEAFTEEETRAIIEFAKEDKLFGVAAYIMLNTGIRSGETRALSPTQINLEEGYITIDRAVKHTEELGLPKNNKTRYIPLEEKAVAFLKDKIDPNVNYLVGNNHYVSRAGFRSRYLHFFNRMNKHLVNQGKNPIPFKSAHATRHTFSTLCQKRGMPIAVVMELMGHSSTDVTDKYTHLGDIATLSEAVKKYSFLGSGGSSVE
jgi:integrase